MSMIDVQEHHIFPKCMRKDNLNIADGKKMPLCKKCHEILHKMILSIVWKYIPENYKDICKKDVRIFSEEWMKND
jgi:hypothetical protein